MGNEKERYNKFKAYLRISNIASLKIIECVEFISNNKVGLDLENLQISKNEMDHLVEIIVDQDIVKITSISMKNNKLMDIPKFLFQLKDLETLDISNNLISKIPDEITQLDNLNHFNISDNRLQQFPNKLLNLDNIEIINISGNNIQSIPPSIDVLFSLRGLYVKNSGIRSLPKTIGNLKKLEVLDISTTIDNTTINQIDKLPSSIRNLTQLKELYIYGNSLGSSLHHLNALKILEILDLSNQRSFSFDMNETLSFIYRYKKLRILRMNQCNITELGSKIGNLKNLEELYLVKNKLEEIPIELCSLDKLKILHLQGNKIKTIPSDISKLENLLEFGIDISNLDEHPHETFEKLHKQGCVFVGLDLLRDQY